MVKVCVGAQLPIPWNTLFTQDFIDEMTGDHLLPSGVLTLQDLGVDPRPVRPSHLIISIDSLQGWCKVHRVANAHSSLTCL